MLLARLFKAHAKPRMMVLDAGCGRSNYVLEANMRVIEKIVGADASLAATEGNALADEIVISDLESLPFEDNSFDAVTCLWVLEHLSNPHRVLSELRRVLKPGGKLFFETPYAFSYILLAKRVAGARLTHAILNALYGRTEEDTFRTEYLANTPKDLRSLFSTVGMKEVVLIENPDPSYLAFNGFFFGLALLLQRISAFCGLKFATMHLIGVFEKPSQES